jgi:hypothetical protein
MSAWERIANDAYMRVAYAPLTAIDARTCKRTVHTRLRCLLKPQCEAERWTLRALVFAWELLHTTDRWTTAARAMRIFVRPCLNGKLSLDVLATHVLPFLHFNFKLLVYRYTQRRALESERQLLRVHDAFLRFYLGGYVEMQQSSVLTHFVYARGLPHDVVQCIAGFVSRHATPERPAPVALPRIRDKRVLCTHLEQLLHVAHDQTCAGLARHLRQLANAFVPLSVC